MTERQNDQCRFLRSDSRKYLDTDPRFHGSFRCCKCESICEMVDSMRSHPLDNGIAATGSNCAIETTRPTSPSAFSHLPPRHASRPPPPGPRPHALPSSPALLPSSSAPLPSSSAPLPSSPPLPPVCIPRNIYTTRRIRLFFWPQIISGARARGWAMGRWRGR